MKIDGYNNIKSSSGVKKRGSASGLGSISSFEDLLTTQEAGGASATIEVAASAPVSGLFALQEVEDASVGRKKLIKRGHDILDSLDELRRGLLLGAVPAHVLRSIDQKITAARGEIAAGFADPSLTAILDEIELRAAVELAKLEMANRG